jgi:amino acid adenylation domain-containing protein
MASHPSPPSTQRTAGDVRQGLQRLRALPRAELKRRLADMPTCSLNQVRLWYSYLLEPESNAYNVPLILHLQGDVDEGAIVQAWSRLLDRHALLRSVHFALDDEVYHVALGPRESILAAQVARIPCDPVRDGLPAAVREAAAAPFDLQAEPPCRCVVVRCLDGSCLLAMVFHHIVVDGWSLRLLSDEVFALYGSLTAAEAVECAPPSRYQDFVQWQLATVSPQALERETAFWRRRLSDLPEPLSIAGKARVGEPAGRADVLAFALGERTGEALRAYCRERGGTPFVGLMAALQALNFRYTGNERPVIGTTTTGRKLPQFEQTIGFFVNTLAVPAELDDDCSFDDLFERQKALLFEAYDNDYVPYEQIVSSIRAEIGHNRPLFNWVLELQPASYSAEPQARGLRIRAMASGQRLAKVDCSFFFSEYDGRFDCQLEYDTQVLDEAGARSLAGALDVLVGNLVDRPGAAIRTLPLTSAQTAADGLARVAGPVSEVESITPAGMLRRAAQGAGERVALSDGCVALTFDELRARVARLAAALADRVPDPDRQLVAIVADRSVDSYVALIACWCAGLGYLPLNPRDPPARLRQLAMAASAGVVLYDARELFDRIDAGAFAGIPCHRIESLVAERSAGCELPDAVPLRTYAIPTSGTTGIPKGCVMSWRSIVNLQKEMASAVLGSGKHSFPCAVTLNAPLFFDASVQQLMLMFAGCSMYVVPEDVRLDPHAFHGFLEHNRIQVLELTPSHFRLLHGHRPVDTLPALRTVMLGAEDIAPDLWRSLRNHPTLEFFNIYGPTECSVDSTVHRIDVHSSAPTIGKAFGNTEFYVVDADENLLPRGAIGQLLIAGVGVRDAYYLDRPDATALQYRPNPFSADARFSRCYRTGDLVRMRMSGEIEYLGRIDGQVKVRGNRVESEEIALVIRASGQALDCRVVVEHDDRAIASLVAYVVPVAPARIDPRALESFVANRLPAHAVPTRFNFVESIPMKPNGKVDLPRLAGMPRLQVERPAAGSAALDADEESVMQVWSAVLQRSDIDPDRSFASVGGHSIQVARMLGMLRDRWGTGVPANVVFGGATIRDLARLLASQRHAQLPPSQRREPLLLAGAGARGAALFCIHPLGGSATPYIALAEVLAAGRPVYAIASRAAAGAEPEHPSLADLVREYADLIARAAGDRPVHLMGWSLGGLLALAIADSLGGRGVRVRSLELWDTGWQRRPPAVQDARAARFSATRAVLDALPIAPAAVERAAAALRHGDAVDVADWLAQLAADPDGASLRLHPQDLERAVELTLRHRELIGQWAPPALTVPVHALWAADSLALGHVSRTPWGELTGARFTDEVVPGTHYTIVRAPLVTGLAERLKARLAAVDRGGSATATHLTTASS